MMKQLLLVVELSFAFGVLSGVRGTNLPGDVYPCLEHEKNVFLSNTKALYHGDSRLAPSCAVLAAASMLLCALYFGKALKSGNVACVSSKKGIPAVISRGVGGPLEFVVNMWSLWNHPLQLLTSIHRENTARVPPAPVVMIPCGPLVGDVALLFDAGLTRKVWAAADAVKSPLLEWWKRKDLLGPDSLVALSGAAFHSLDAPIRDLVKKLASSRDGIIREELGKWFDDWNRRRESTGCNEFEADIYEEMFGLALRLIVRLLFDAEESGFRLKVEEAARNAFGSVHQASSFPLFASARKYKGARERLYGLVMEAIVRRSRVAKPSADDGLQQLLAIGLPDAPLSTSQVCQQAVTLLGGGLETTSKLLAWLFGEITRPENGHWQEELSTVDSTSSAAASLVTKLTMEALRLYPTSWILGRKLEKDLEVQASDGQAVCFPAGTTVLFSQYLASGVLSEHDPKFDPSRTATTSSVSTPSFMAFGHGEHFCPGRPYALKAIQFILTGICQRYVLSRSDPDQLPSRVGAGNMLPSSSIMVRFRRRCFLGKTSLPSPCY